MVARERCFRVRLHFIDRDWNFQTIILEFRLFPYSQDSESISKLMEDVIESLEITSKMVGITTDNGSNVVASKRYELFMNCQLDLNKNKK